MSYPTGGSGYNAPTPTPSPTPSSAPSFGQQPTGSASGGSGSSALSAKGLTFYLTVGIAVLGLVNFLLGFLSFVSFDEGAMRSDTKPDTGVSLFQQGGTAPLLLLLFAGLVAGVALLPKQEAKNAVIAAAAVAGFFGVLFQSFMTGQLYKTAGTAWVLVFLALVQAAVAVVALLFEIGVLSAPEPKPAVAAGGAGAYGQQPYGQAGQQSQQAQYGQSQAGQQASYGQYGQQYGQAQQGQAQAGQAQAGQAAQGQQAAYGQYGQQYGQGQYGQQPSAYGQPGQQPYGAAGAQGAQPQQQSPYAQRPQTSGGDEAATQHFGSAATPTQQAGQQAGQQFGSLNFGQQGQGGAAQPFGGEQTGNPAADATKAFRPEDDQK